MKSLIESPQSHHFPVGKAPKGPKSQAKAEKNVLFYFNDGSDVDKISAKERLEQRKEKYSIKLNVGPDAGLDVIKGALADQGLKSAASLRIYVSGNAVVRDPKDFKPLALSKRKIGGKSLDQIQQIISYVIQETGAKSVYINLHSSETGIMPGHQAYEQVIQAEEKYDQNPSAMILQLKLPLTDEPLSQESIAEYLARKFKNDGCNNITIAGVNGVLIDNGGKTEAVIARGLYTAEKSIEDRRKACAELKQAIVAKDSQAIAKTKYQYLMHIRKVKVSI